MSFFKIMKLDWGPVPERVLVWLEGGYGVVVVVIRRHGCAWLGVWRWSDASPACRACIYTCVLLGGVLSGDKDFESEGIVDWSGCGEGFL